MHHVHIAATAAVQAQALIDQLQSALTAQQDFAWQAGAANALPTGDAVLLITPPLAASNQRTPQDEAAMMALRARLVAHSLPFQVLPGPHEHLVQQALAALCNWFPDAASLQARRAALREHGALDRWQWSCEKCSDPECEFRLFKGLYER